MPVRIGYAHPLSEQQQIILTAAERTGGCWNVNLDGVDCLSIGARGRTAIVKFALLVASADPELGAAMASDVDVLVHGVGNPTYIFANVDKIPFVFTPYVDDEEDDDDIPEAIYEVTDRL